MFLCWEGRCWKNGAGRLLPSCLNRRSLRPLLKRYYMFVYEIFQQQKSKQPRMVPVKLLATILGRSSVAPGGSGAPFGRSRRACYSRPGMLQPPWHVTGPSSAIISKQMCCTLLLVRSCVSPHRC